MPARMAAVLSSSGSEGRIYGSPPQRSWAFRQAGRGTVSDNIYQLKPKLTESARSGPVRLFPCEIAPLACAASAGAGIPV